MLVVVRSGVRTLEAHLCASLLPAARSHSIALQLPQQVPLPTLWSRHFTGRASRGGPAAEEAKDAKDSGGSGVAGGAEGVHGSSLPQAAAASAGGSGTEESTKASPSAVYSLALYRKPAFPGFYQVVQVSEQEVLDFLFELRKNGQGEHLAGFMTTQPRSQDVPTTISLPGPAGGQGAKNPAPAVRCDAGRVDSASELEEVGTLLQVVNLTQYPNFPGGQVVVMPQRRLRRTRVVSNPSPAVPLPSVAIDYLEEPEITASPDVKAAHNEIIATMKQLVTASFLYKEQFEQVIRFYSLDNPIKIAHLVSGMSLGEREDLQAVLMEEDLMERLRKVLFLAKKDLEFVRLQSQVKGQVEEEMGTAQKKMMLMAQMKQIKKELGMEKDDKQTLITQFQEAIKDKTLPEDASKVIEAELGKLGTLEPTSSEFNVCRTYLEWLTCLPWEHVDPESKDIDKAESILNDDHYGLEDVKERILEHIAVSFLKESVQGKIMCLVGPPGVGKTSIGKSIARALDRKFYRFSVGGMADVAELRGHRRTYVGAMPGKLIQCLKITQTSNPVVLIDEIDKLGQHHGGSPASAFLEILDPEQNSGFRDHYLDVPVDLSKVLFVCTANTLDTIPGPLLDRMEVIRIAGYVFEEKAAIANQYLIPQTAESSGVGADTLEIQPEALNKMIRDYAREAGVRHLRQLLEKVSRKVALSMVRSKRHSTTDTAEGERIESERVSIGLDSLTKYIGQPLHLSDLLYPDGKTPPGVVTGLAWTAMGGVTLFVEARGRVAHGFARGGLPLLGTVGDTEQEDTLPSTDASTFKGTMKVTGQLGSVMNESSAISLTYAQIFVRELDPANSFLDQAHIHLHAPEGATPKDGPSAGVTMASALVSLALNQPIRPNVAMTGELTLTGKVLKVGGIKEKVIGAKREGVHTLILPKHNEADYSDLKEYLRAGLTAHFVDHFDDVYRFAFDQGQVTSLPFLSRGRPVVSVATPLTEGPKPLVDGGTWEPNGESGDGWVPVSESEPSQQPTLRGIQARGAADIGGHKK